MQHEEISADADSDYVYRSDFDNYEKTHFPPKFAPAAADVAVMEGTPVKKAQVLKAPALVPASSKIALALRKSGQRDQQNNDEAFDDEEYEVSDASLYSSLKHHTGSMSVLSLSARKYLVVWVALRTLFLFHLRKFFDPFKPHQISSSCLSTDESEPNT